MVIIIWAFVLLSVAFMVPVCMFQFYSKPLNIKQNCILLASIVFIIAFAFEFKGTPDIYRYYVGMAQYGNMSLSQVISQDKTGLFVYDFLAWIIGKIGVPQLLPAFSASTVYGIASYITCDYAKEIENQKKTYIVVLAQLLTLPLFQILSNIRNVFAFSLVLLAVYEDLVKKKRGLYLIALYVIPCFIHNSAFILVAFRLVALISEKVLVITAILSMFASNVINIIYNSIAGRITLEGVIGEVLNTALDRAYHYINGIDTSSYSRAVQESTFHNVLRVTTFISAILLLYLAYTYIKNKNSQHRLFATFIFFSCISTLASNIFAAPNYWRFFAAANIGMGVVLLPYTSNQKLSINKAVYLAFVGSAVLLTILHCYGNLSFVDYEKTIENLIYTNAYTVLYRVLKGIVMI